jgi:uncharacterized protein
MVELGLGIAVGLVLGLTGAGGSILAVPLLMVGFGWSLPQAAPVALLAVATAAIIGTAGAWRHDLVRYRAALLMAALGFMTAPLGILMAQAMPLLWLNTVFALILIVVAARMFMQARSSPDETTVVRAVAAGQAGAAVCRLNPATGRLSWTSPCAGALAVTGAVTGLVSGMLGVGGGFIIVPALRRLTQLNMHAAVGTSLMVIALISAGGVAGALLQGVAMPWDIAWVFVAGAVGGMLAGRWLAPLIAGPRLQQGFAVLMCIVAAGMLVTLIQAVTWR